MKLHPGKTGQPIEALARPCLGDQERSTTWVCIQSQACHGKGERLEPTGGREERVRGETVTYMLMSIPLHIICLLLCSYGGLLLS
jgi:hypothetical protein